MSQEQSVQVVMEHRIGHSNEERLMKAYRRLQQMQSLIQSRPTSNPTDPTNKENEHGTSSVVRPGFDSQTGTGSNH